MKLKLPLKVLFLMLGLFASYLGGNARCARAFTPAELFPPDSIHAKTLPNGVRALVRSTPGTGVVSLQIWAEAGSRFETSKNNGAAHIIEMLAMQGSKNYPTLTDDVLSGPQPRIENLGGIVGSYVSRDDMFWNATVAPTALEQTAKIMADAVLYPNLTDTDVDAAKTIAAGDIMAHRLDPVAYSEDLAYGAVFQKHPYRLPAYGSLSSLQQLSGKDVREYHKKRFTGSHLRVVVIGDIDAAAATKIIEDAFADVPKSTEKEAAIPEEPMMKGTGHIQERGALPIKVITFAWRSPAVSNAEEAVATDVLLTYLNEGYNSALRRVLQDDDDNNSDEDGIDTNEEPSGLAGGYNASYLTQRDSGLFLINILAPFKEDEAKSEVLQLINRANSGLSEKELNSAKITLQRQYVEQAESSSGQAGGVGFYDTIASYQFAMDYPKMVDKIDSAAIARVAQKYFRTDNYMQVTLLPTLRNPQQQQNGGILAALPNNFALD